MHAAPRQRLVAPIPVLPGSGLPMERQAQLAARCSFFDIQRAYSQAAADIPGIGGEHLRQTIAQADDPADLWMLRAAVLMACAGEDCAAQRVSRQQRLDSGFSGLAEPGAARSR